MKKKIISVLLASMMVIGLVAVSYTHLQERKREKIFI